jgi:hypothetical protein
MSQSGQGVPRRSNRGPLAETGVFLAVSVLLVLGILSVLQGIAALANDEVFQNSGAYAYRFSLTAWGWIQVVLGALMFLTGLGLLREAFWARVAGVVFAALNIVASFAFAPNQPVWSIVLIGLGAFVIWSLCVMEST